MIKKLLAFIILACAPFGHAQLIINNTQTPAQLVQHSFSGLGMQISNVKFNGSTANAEMIRDQAAKFETNFNPTNLGLSTGVILCTGKANIALGPNNDTDATSPTSLPVYGDPDLAMLTTSSVSSKAALEFDFVAVGNTVLFQYVFASEEYPEYANTAYNDVFGIFLSGPGISGPYSGNAKNMAVIPNTSVPVSINNINNGLTNTGPCENCAYYVNNGTGTTPSANPHVQFDGFTTVLTATSDIILGQTYHVKIAIANVSDNSFDSAVFLKASSFTNPLKATAFSKDIAHLFPNPANDAFEIKLDGEKIASVQLYGIMGEKVQQFSNIGSDQFRVDVSHFAKGFYLVEIETENQTRLTKKLLIE